MAVVDNAIETQGTRLFFVDTGGSSTPGIVKLTCPTGITGVNGGTKSRIDTSCLDIPGGGFRQYVGGLADADEVSVPFVMYKSDAGQEALKRLQTTNPTVSWMVVLSDEATDPTTLDSDDDINFPAGGGYAFRFRGYVANLTYSVDTNEVVRGSLTIQPTGATEASWE